MKRRRAVPSAVLAKQKYGLRGQEVAERFATFIAVHSAKHA